ncbi:hypothetical protein QUA56_26355 [Microcoleus sp. N3A4]
MAKSRSQLQRSQQYSVCRYSRFRSGLIESSSYFTTPPPRFYRDVTDDVANFRNQLSQGPDFKPASIFAYQKIDRKLFQLQFVIEFTVQLSDRI